MTTMIFPRIQSQQATSIYAQQTTVQQTSGVDISNLINLLMPVMVVAMMMKMMVSTIGRTGKAKQLETASGSTSKKGDNAEDNG